MLLAILAVSPYPVSRYRLARMLWSQRAEEQSRSSLRQEIYRLQGVLNTVSPELFRVNRDQLTVRHDRIWVDVVEALTATVQDPKPLALLSAIFLDGYDRIDPVFDDWLSTEREKLLLHARTVLEGQIAVQGSPQGVLAMAGQLLRFDSAHEGAWRARIQAYADLGQRGRAIETYEHSETALMHRLGVSPSAETQQLIAKIRRSSLSHSDLVDPGDPIVSPHRPHGRLQMGVLPFRLSGMEPEQTFLSMTLADEVTTALARFPGLGLLAPSTLASQAADSDALRERFGLALLVEGHLYPANDSVRIHLKIIDLRNNHRLVWSGRFDAPQTDLPGLHDDLVGRMAAQINLNIQTHESRRASLIPVEQCDACELVLRAWPMTSRFHRPEFDDAEALLRRAIELEPEYAAAHTRLAYHLVLAIGQDWAADRQAVIDEAVVCSDRAMVLAPKGARAHTVAGHVRAYLQRRPKEAMALHERALSLNPNLALGWGLSALACTYLGDLVEANRRIERYRYLVPNASSAFLFEAGSAVVEIGRGDYVAAIDAGRRTTELNPGFIPGLRIYLVALGHGGMITEAAIVRQRLLLLQPNLTVRAAMAASPYQDAQQREHFGAGLRLAGIPEGDTVDT
jgi:DNA-binding SARP family transcriptional activator/TolB-like protein